MEHLADPYRFNTESENFVRLSTIKFVLRVVYCLPLHYPLDES